MTEQGSQVLSKKRIILRTRDRFLDVIAMVDFRTRECDECCCSTGWLTHWGEAMANTSAAEMVTYMKVRNLPRDRRLLRVEVADRMCPTTPPASEIAKLLCEVQSILAYGGNSGSVNLYMAHGGTNFGFWAGDDERTALQRTQCICCASLPCSQRNQLRMLAELPQLQNFEQYIDTEAEM